MKKSKTFTYLLLTVVMALWGVVFYRIYKSFFAEKNVAMVAENPLPLKKIREESETGFVLKANYQDPFLGRFFAARASQIGAGSAAARKPKPAAPVKKEEVKIDWSFIGYYGLIKNQHSNKQVALVSVQGKEYMVEEGDVVNDVSFIKYYKDSVKVSYQGNTVFLRKK